MQHYTVNNKHFPFIIFLSYFSNSNEIVSLEGDGQRKCFMGSESGLTLFKSFRLWIIWTPDVYCDQYERKYIKISLS